MPNACKMSDNLLKQNYSIPEIIETISKEIER